MNLLGVVFMGNFRWVVLIYHEEVCGTSRDLEMNTRKWIGMKFQRGKSVVTWFGNRWRWNQAAKAR